MWWNNYKAYGYICKIALLLRCNGYRIVRNYTNSSRAIRSYVGEKRGMGVWIEI